MAEETDAQEDKVNSEIESTNEPVNKNEKLSRVKEKLVSMGMMPGKDDSDKTATEQARTRKPVLLMATLAVVAIILGSLAFYASDFNKHTTTIVKAESNSMPASHYPVMNMRAPAPKDIVWPKPLSADHLKNLQEARQFYWQREFQKSEQAYEELLEEIKDQPGLYGELGNVQFYASKPEKAMESYYQAALLLIGQNRHAETGHAISAVARFDHNKAKELMDKLASKHYSQ